MKYASSNIGFSPSLFLSCLVMTFLLSSCMNSNISDLEQYVHREKSKAPDKIPPLPEVKPYTTYTYNQNALRNPFVSENIGMAQSIEECPQVTRAKDALEMVPLDSLTLVGSLEQQGQRWALVKDQESTVHRLKKGARIGQNNGQIIVITESEVVLQELVSDRLQGCIKRQTTLAASLR